MIKLSIDRRGTVEQVAGAVEAQILDGSLRPGTPLKDSRIADDLDLSRNSVREAFRGLVSTGLVQHRPHRGFAVAELDAHDIVDLYRARAAIELTAADAPLRALRGVVGTLEAQLEALVGAQRRKDWNGVFRAHRRFHGALVDTLGSPRLGDFHERVFGELRLAMANVEHARPAASKTRREHEAFIDCIGGGDRRGLERLTKAHLETGLERVLGHLADGPAKRSLWPSTAETERAAT